MAINAVGNPVNALPSFITFNLDPKIGPNLCTWSIKPYKEWFPDVAKNEHTSLIVLKNSTAGIITGSALGYGADRLIDFFAEKIPKLKQIKDTVLCATSVGTAVGGAIGFVRGLIKVEAFHLNRPVVMCSTIEASTKAKKIVEVFVATHLENNPKMDQITCPISLEIMVYPVDIDCGSNVKHVFEYYSILTWLGRQQALRCPLCNRAVQIKNLALHTRTETKVHDAVSGIFKAMEAILQKLPKRHLGLDNLPDFSDPSNIQTLADHVKEGKKFLEEDIDSIAEKIKQSDSLSLDETFALGYFLIHQFKPLKHKIDQIYKISGDYLRDLYIQARIDKSSYEIQLDRLEKWYATFDVIPKDCKITRTLYQI